jgi:hypothetical protein
MYLTQSIIADDPYMRLRVASCAAQQGVTDVGIDPDEWTRQWRRVWASSPGWDTAWESAKVANPPVQEPGADTGVITDGMILSQVQSMMPFITVESNKPEISPAMTASREYVQQMLEPMSRIVSEIKQTVDGLVDEDGGDAQ